jgi:hypothetical protein
VKFYSKPFFLVGIFLLCCSLTESSAQRFDSVVFDKLPEDMQLYARDDQNEATISISGVVEAAGLTHMSTVIFKENVRIGYTKSVLQYNGSSRAHFSMSPKIKSELAEYSFEVYACRASDSVQLVRRDKVLAGDFYLINGQSNANRDIRYETVLSDAVKKFSRTIGRAPDDNLGFTAADTTWANPDLVTPTPGYWGRDLQRQIIEKYNIPVCVINSAVPGSGIESHIIRNASKPSDPSNIYGSLLLRALKSKATRIRAFFWYQGEQDIWSDPGPYPERFNTLMSFWQKDYPMVDRFVVIQLNILTGLNYTAGALREFQRKTKYLYPKTDHFAVMGLGHMEDDTHFNGEGYTKLATQLLDFLGPKEYKSTITDNTGSPDIQKVFYSKTKDAINMVFDQNQTLKWAADTVEGGMTTRLQDQFFLDGDESKPASITSWQVRDNRITLRLASPINASKLNYILSFRRKRYNGPYIKNTRGLGAFSFHEFPIASALEDPSLISAISNSNVVQLSWKKITDATSYILERKEASHAEFTKIKTFADNSTTLFDDASVNFDRTYIYRISAIGTKSESQSETTIKSLELLGVEPEPSVNDIVIFPNPAKDFMDVTFPHPVTGKMTLVTTSGKTVSSAFIDNSKKAKMSVSNIPASTYILTFTSKNGVIMARRIVKL